MRARSPRAVTAASTSSRLIRLSAAARGSGLGLGGYLLGLRLSDPRADDGEVAADVDAGAVASDLGIEFRDASPSRLRASRGGGVFELTGLPGELGYRRVDAVGGEEFAEPVDYVYRHGGSHGALSTAEE